MVKPDAVDWKATIDEALERGKAVPEVEWCIPGEKAATQVYKHLSHALAYWALHVALWCYLSIECKNTR